MAKKISMVHKIVSFNVSIVSFGGVGAGVWKNDDKFRFLKNIELYEWSLKDLYGFIFGPWVPKNS